MGQKSKIESFTVYLLAEGCLVLVELVIRYRNLRAPQSYPEAFAIMGENGILDPKFAYDFAKIAGFRNFWAQEYERIDPSFICEKILPKLEDVDRFLDVIAEKCG